MSVLIPGLTLVTNHKLTPGESSILLVLLQGKKTVSQLAEATNKSIPNVQRFISILKLKGLVECEKVGRSRLYVCKNV